MKYLIIGKRVCVAGYSDELPCDMSHEFFDQWPLVWQNFSRAGYVTHYAEDYPNFNLFKYLSNGFKRKPVDHYFRPFWVKLWPTFLHRRSTHLCFGNKPKHLLQLEYLERLFKTYVRAEKKTNMRWFLTNLLKNWFGRICGLGKTFHL